MKKVDPGKTISNELGDFTTTPRLLKISALALAIGPISAFVALGLLKLIALFTNIFFYQRLSVQNVQPMDHHLGLFVVVVPIIGGLIIGFMARYGSERIRGHGIPEAIEAILLNGSRVELRLVVYKMAETGITSMPVVERGDSRKVYGTVSLVDLLRGRARDLEEERRRERILRLRLPFGFGETEEIRETEETNR